MIKKKPFISVFTPNYNNGRYISETIKSILNQTYFNFEYIIIDDCSTDNSWIIIKKYAQIDKRIKIYRNNKNLNIVKTRNKGFKLSSPHSKYFAILDSDDIALPDRLSRQVIFLEKNFDYGLVGSNAIIINEESEKIGYRTFPSQDKTIRKTICKYNPIAHSSVMLRKKAIEEVGFYDRRWEVCEDYDYWLRVGISWKLGNIDDFLIKYRISRNQIKSRRIKETLKKTYKIQLRAVNYYGYKDNFLNKFIRIILLLFLIYPKIAYYMYSFFLSSFKRIKTIYL